MRNTHRWYWVAAVLSMGAVASSVTAGDTVLGAPGARQAQVSPTATDIHVSLEWTFGGVIMGADTGRPIAGASYRVSHSAGDCGPPALSAPDGSFKAVCRPFDARRLSGLSVQARGYLELARALDVRGGSYSCQPCDHMVVRLVPERWSVWLPFTWAGRRGTSGR